MRSWPTELITQTVNWHFKQPWLVFPHFYTAEDHHQRDLQWVEKTRWSGLYNLEEREDHLEFGWNSMQCGLSSTPLPRGPTTNYLWYTVTNEVHAVEWCTYKVQLPRYSSYLSFLLNITNKSSFHQDNYCARRLVMVELHVVLNQSYNWGPADHCLNNGVGLW